MNRWFILFLLLLPCTILAQVQPGTAEEQQLENITETHDDADVTDDSWLQQMEYLKKKPLNLNNATESDLQELQLLSAIQINHFITYRNLLGKFISIYELQAIPAWDITLIQKLLPFVTVGNSDFSKTGLSERFLKGENTALIRFSRLLEKSAGYLIEDTSRSYYAGDPSKLMIRYKYQYKNLLQYGFTAAKDAGEQYFKKGSTVGFDFYSAHLFARNIGMIKAFALGDYTINLGQGLICWQGLAFGKGGDVMNVKRQSAALRPYNSSGAYFFNRGIATTLAYKRWLATAFFSARKLDANFSGNDINDDDVASSIHVSGYHRTQSEIEDRNTLRLFSYGANITYKSKRWHIGFNSIQYAFNNNVQKKEVPYNLYALQGKRWSNSSIDYSFTYRNFHFFGETAIDKNYNPATINGILFSADKRVDMVLLHRFISPAYQSLYGNAFTASTMPTNERGMYMGISIKPNPRIKADFYADVFHFPWLKYRIDAPSYGKDYFIQLSYKPSKTAELYTRYRVQYKPINTQIETNALNNVMPFSNRSWRTQINYQLSLNCSVRQRFELLWYDSPTQQKEKGFLTYFDVFYKPGRSKISINTRLQYFESDSYNSRLYAYENDVLYYYAVPVFYNTGTRYYINVRYSFKKNTAIWLKWSQTIYKNATIIGSGLDEINGNRKSEIRVLLSTIL
ncbi:MAG: helix-hairpin-helix domain-containing protein [Agriterribacter sp.]